MKHVMRLNSQPFEMIKNGEKTIELRLYDEKRKNVQVGDEIEFIHSLDENQRLRCRVLKLYLFSSFEELHANLPLLKCGYTLENISSACPKDMETYYSREEQEEYGVVGIELKVL